MAKKAEIVNEIATISIRIQEIINSFGRQHLNYPRLQLENKDKNHKSAYNPATTKRKSPIQKRKIRDARNLPIIIKIKARDSTHNKDGASLNEEAPSRGTLTLFIFL